MSPKEGRGSVIPVTKCDLLDYSSLELVTPRERCGWPLILQVSYSSGSVAVFTCCGGSTGGTCRLGFQWISMLLTGLWLSPSYTVRYWLLALGLACKRRVESLSEGFGQLQYAGPDQSGGLCKRSCFTASSCVPSGDSECTVIAPCPFVAWYTKDVGAGY